MSSDTTALYVEHRSSLIDYATRIVGSRAQAEDVVQEAWLRFDCVARQRLLSEPLPYLYRIVRNLALDGRRRLVLERGIVIDSDLEVVEAPTGEPTPETAAVYRDDLRLLREVMNELPERTRIAFEMYRIGGCKLREVADFLDISVALAQALVADALEHCKHRLKWP